MRKIRILPLTLFFGFVALIFTPIAESQIMGGISRPPPTRARPLCLSQFALANHACAMLPYSATPYTPPSAPSPPSGDELLEGMSHHHRHHHHHHHHDSRAHQNQGEHRHSETPTPVQEDCCRWLMAVDDECICEVLLRLPIFLARPFHQYSVIIDESCSITYNCGGRILG